MASPARQAPPDRVDPRLYAELCALPAHQVGEILDQHLHVSPRPRMAHALGAMGLSNIVGGPFHFGRGGPGGWIILTEPELHLSADVVVPDLAGWRRQRLPRLPNAPALTLAPDWACEIISASTERIDRTVKRDIYAREGVGHLWFIEPTAQTLEAFRLEGGRWTLTATVAGDAIARIEPFDAIELELALLWADVEPAPPE